MRTWTFIYTMIILIALLLVLQIIYSILLEHLWKYEHKGILPNAHEVNVYTVEAERLIVHLTASFENKVLDDSGQYHIIQNVISNVNEDNRDVSLAIHASVDSLKFLPSTIKQWEGPVSVAVFVTPEMADEAALRILALRLCSDGALSLHVVVPAGAEVTRPSVLPPQATLCRALETVPSRSYQLTVPYPNNLLRNVARQATLSEFVLSLDADMAPSAGLRRQFLDLVDAGGLWEAPSQRLAFVLPLYEVGEGVTPPRDKTTLLDLRRRWPQLLRPFYIAACAKCQAPTGFERWEAAGATGRLQPLYDVPWIDPWEPVYVVRRSAPLYDPRFRQFGFNRISHACELHVAGYTFRVLGDGFVLHLGLKGDEPPRVEQQAEQDMNRLLFRQFKQELKTKYPESARRCY